MSGSSFQRAIRNLFQPTSSVSTLCAPRASCDDHVAAADLTAGNTKDCSRKTQDPGGLRRLSILLFTRFLGHRHTLYPPGASSR